MKLNMKYVIFGCVLLLVILLTMATSCGAVPYSPSTRSYSSIEGFDVEKLKSGFNGKLTYFLNDLKKTRPSVDIDYIKDEFSMIETIRKQENYDIKMIKQQLTLAADKFDNDSQTNNMIQTFIEKQIQPIIDSEHDALLINSKSDSDMATAAVVPTSTTEPTTTAAPTTTTDATKPVVQGFTTISGSQYTIDKFSSAVGNQSCVKTASGLSNSMGALCLSEEQLYMLQSRGGNSTGRDSQIGM
jgi:hypothetical protein